MPRILADAVRFAVDSSLRFSAPPAALRLRWITYPRVVLGGILGRLYHALRVPFEYTPLASLPFIVAGAWLLYEGHLLAGVLCSVVHMVNDSADGVAMGYAVDRLREEDKPRARMRLRRLLDARLCDVAARFALYLVLVARLHELGLVSPALLALLLAIEVGNTTLSTAAEQRARTWEFHYDFVLDPTVARRMFGRTYALKVWLCQLTAYHVYALYPLLGYVLPLSRWGVLVFAVVFTVRAVTLGVRVRESLLPGTPSRSALTEHPSRH